MSKIKALDTDDPAREHKPFQGLYCIAWGKTASLTLPINKGKMLSLYLTKGIIDDRNVKLSNGFFSNKMVDINIIGEQVLD